MLFLLVPALLALGGILFWAWNPAVPDLGPSGPSREKALPPPSPMNGAQAKRTKAPRRKALLEPEHTPFLPNHSPEYMTLQVLEAKTGKPCPGAKVWILDRQAPGLPLDDWAVISPLPDPTAWYSRYGKRYTADPKGRVMLPRMYHCQAWGRWGDLGGWVELDGVTCLGRKLCLYPRTPLRVQVVDSSGKPVGGVPLALYVKGPGKWEEYLLQGFSKEHTGTLEIPWIPFYLAYAGDSLAVTFAFPHEPPVKIPLDPEQAPPHPVRIVLPPAGSLEVQVLGPGGLPVQGDAAVGLGPVVGGPDYSPIIKASGFAPVQDGKAFFPFVGLGMRLRLQAEKGKKDWTAQPVDRIVQGPKNPGEKVTVRLSFQADTTLFLGRALGPGGKPLANRPLQGSLWIPSLEKLEMETLRTLTDREGRFSLAIQGYDPPRGGVLALTTPGRPSRKWERFCAQLNISLGKSAAPMNLGDLLFKEAPLLASGKVVKKNGKGVPHLLLIVEECLGHPKNGVWEMEPTRLDLCTWTDETGKFEIRGILNNPRLAIQPDLRRSFGIPERIVPPGTKGITFVLPEKNTGLLEGRVLLDPGVPKGILNVSLEISKNGEYLL